MTQPIAVIGVGCVLPDAPNVEQFWANLLGAKMSIRDVPAGRWNVGHHYSADKSIPDKTSAKIGAWVDDDSFNGLEFRLPPKVVEQIDPCQRWALSATRQALRDAGYATGIKTDGGKEFDRENCAVILGNAMGGEFSKTTPTRLSWPELEASLLAAPQFRALPAATQTEILTESKTNYLAGKLDITEDTMPGHLANVVAGRIANVFDLRGKNFTTDAACASSLAALDAAIAALEKGDATTVIWGGSDRSMDVSTYIQFSKIGALSPDGSRPFDQSSNGFVMGEGCAMFVLKRHEDAVRDGDKIYAVFRGIGSSSDGKGKGITAPNPRGQILAVERAWKDSTLPHSSLQYLEAHGTSTPVGDPVELESVASGLTGLAPGSILVGSVKSNIGHLKAAAGAAGILKTVLAVHHGIIPPSLGVTTPNPRIDWTKSPFKVATTKTTWNSPVRTAAISSFGFGGTNFHVVLQNNGPHIQSSKAIATSTPKSLPTEPRIVLIAARELDAFEAAFASQGEAAIAEFGVRALQANTKVSFVWTDAAGVAKSLALARKAISTPAAMGMAAAQGVFIGRKAEGKIAFLFPGQGTQYVNMGRELAANFAEAKEAFQQAHKALSSEVEGGLLPIIWPTDESPEGLKKAEAKLRLTEYTQPAVLAMDAAVLNILGTWNLQADVVAGHSLGEYGALLAAGVLTLDDAIHAVAARGREMAHVKVPDLGTMASVSADWVTVTKALEGMTEYVIPANKNCPSQTVIAGSTPGIEEAMKRLGAAGLQTMQLPVSAAFHSSIVAPASGPLRKVLERLDVKSPKIPVISNVDAANYQEDPNWIRDNLAKQVASPVEWIGTIERMYSEGVRCFIEVGPKRALTGFVQDILQAKNDFIAVNANHPKKGDLTSLAELRACLAAFGLPVVAFGESAPQVAQIAATVAAPVSTNNLSDELATKLRTLATDVENLTKQVKPVQATQAPGFNFYTGPISASGTSFALPGKDKPLFDDSDFSKLIAGKNFIDSLPANHRAGMLARNIVRLVKGAGGSADWKSISEEADVIKLAGQRGSFNAAEFGVDAELLSTLDVTSQYAIVAALKTLADAGIPLVEHKKQTSQGTFLPGPWRLPQAIGSTMGIIFASAFPGYDNFAKELTAFATSQARSEGAHVLDRIYREMANLPGDQATRKAAMELVEKELDKSGPTYEFNRKFLFMVLSMGHSQLAQFIGAQGPNTQVNAACASTTQAIAMAEDWIRAGRADRVLIVGADDATSPNLMDWIGSGFLASGAATTEALVKDAALPFDRRRHGMIIGMGAVGLLLEKEADVRARGRDPIAKLLAATLQNSAFHGSRLDTNHIAVCMQNLLKTASDRYGVIPAQMASQTMFMSHETYTPARGGSASAEAKALRETFGSAVGQVIVANVKGFTGHPQGAGIEDSVVLRCLQHQQAPPIPNLVEPDPELADLNLSKGGAWNGKYALRLAAGFGSQVAMALWEKQGGIDLVRDPQATKHWAHTHLGAGEFFTQTNQLRYRLTGEAKAAPAPVAAPVAQAAVAPPTPIAGTMDVLPELLNLVVEMTGYPKELLDADLDMEADLGIDTVKQAELMVALRTKYNIPQEEGLQIKDYPTLRKVAGYVESKAGGAPSQPATPTVAPVVQAPAPAAPATPAPTPVAAPAQSGSAADVLPALLDLVVDMTGYPKDLLDPELDMEADLGIDTVKQAELMVALRAKYNLPAEEGLQIKDYPTLKAVAGYVASRRGGAPQAAPTQVAATPVVAAPVAPVVAPVTQAPVATPTPTASPDVLATVTKIVAEKTGYPAELLEPDLDMEADLGIDTVKQAELFAELRDTFGVPMQEGLQLKDYPTLRLVAGYMSNQSGSTPAPTAPAVVAAAPVATSATVGRFAIKSFDPMVSRKRREGTLKLCAPFGLESDLKGALRDADIELVATEDASGILIDARNAKEAPQVKELFQFAKKHDFSSGSWFLVTRLDGFGGTQTGGSGRCAALFGFTKALSKEWPNADVRAIDTSLNTYAQNIASELHSTRLAAEICLDGKKTRLLKLESAPLPVAKGNFATQHWIVSGGGQGITAKILQELATAGQKFTILGRTKLTAEAQTWAKWAQADWDAQKQRTMDSLKAEGKLTPVNISRALEGMRKQVEIFTNLSKLQEKGCQVAYYDCDVSKKEPVAKAMADARARLGAFTGVVHAAGVEVSKLLADKPEEQFDLVYDIKERGLENLLAGIIEPLSVLVGFSSIAARFGNAGQVDYSAGNEYVAKRIAQAASSHDIATAFTVCWGPWADIGMATKGSIMQVLDAAGVEAIPAHIGVQIAVTEFSTPGIREVVVCGKLGAFEPQLPEAEPTNDRLLNSIAVSDRSATAKLSMDRQGFVVDHAIDGVPLLPGVIGLEAMIELANNIHESKAFEIRDVDYLKPIKKHKPEAVEVLLEADIDGSTCRTRVLRQARTPDGTPLGPPQVHFRATITGRAGKHLKTAQIPGRNGAIRASSIYPPFFHGPSFQVLENASVTGQEATGCMATGLPASCEESNQFLGHPLVIEALFQLCGLWGIHTNKVMALPSRIGQLSLEPSNATDIRLWCEYKGKDDEGRLKFDAAACDQSGHVLVRMLDFRLIPMGSAEINARAPASPAPLFDPAIPGVSFGVAIIEEGLSAELSSEECNDIAVLKTPERKRAYAAGRVAAKRAAKACDPTLLESNLTVRKDETGKPILTREGKVSAAHLSITHRGKHALAALSTKPIGIDLEMIEPRSETFVEECFSDSESETWSLVDDRRIAMAWAAKEAYLKRAGVGLNVALRSILVKPNGDGTAKVTGPHGDGIIRFYEFEDAILAICV